MWKERWKAGLDQGGENTVVLVCLTNLATVDTTYNHFVVESVYAKTKSAHPHIDIGGEINRTH
jgi:hypothetical protein